MKTKNFCKHYRSKPYYPNGSLIFSCYDYDNRLGCYRVEPFTVEFCQYTGAATITLHKRNNKRLNLGLIKNYLKLKRNPEGRKILKKIESYREQCFDLLPNRRDKNARKQKVELMEAGSARYKPIGYAVKTDLDSVITCPQDHNLLLTPEHRRAKTARIKAKKRAKK